MNVVVCLLQIIKIDLAMTHEFKGTKPTIQNQCQHFN